MNTLSREQAHTIIIGLATACGGTQAQQDGQLVRDYIDTQRDLLRQREEEVSIAREERNEFYNATVTLKGQLAAAQARIAELEAAMEKAASMAGQDWLEGQLLLSNVLSSMAQRAQEDQP